MEKRDFIYQFTDILLSEIVKETIFIENWKESDFDYRYAEYINIFQNMLEACMTQGSTDETLLKRLNDSRKKVIMLFNDKMKSNFCDAIIYYGKDKNEAERLLPSGLFCDDKINSDMLSEFRKFEETTLKGRPKGGSAG
jgi:hypothetical protein